MYLERTLGTTFGVNFEQRRCVMSVYTAVGTVLKMSSALILREESVDFVS